MKRERWNRAKNIVVSSKKGINGREREKLSNENKGERKQSQTKQNKIRRNS